MASNDIAFTAAVSAEKLAHDALADLAKRLFAEHGIRLDSVAFSWLNMTDGRSALLSVECSTYSTATSRGV